MKNTPNLAGSIVTCVNKRDGTVLKVGTATRMIGPALADPNHVMLGAGCGDWGVCIYLTLDDAAKLRSELDQLITDHVERA